MDANVSNSKLFAKSESIAVFCHIFSASKTMQMNWIYDLGFVHYYVLQRSWGTKIDVLWYVKQDVVEYNIILQLLVTWIHTEKIYWVLKYNKKSDGIIARQ